MRTAELILRRPGKPEEIFQIDSAETLIGRAPSADLQLPDDSISREHAVILCEDDVYSIEDLQSTNGIRVNEKRVRSTPLQSGDEIRIGTTLLTLVIRG